MTHIELLNQVARKHGKSPQAIEYGMRQVALKHPESAKALRDEVAPDKVDEYRQLCEFICSMMDGASATDLLTMRAHLDGVAAQKAARN